MQIYKGKITIIQVISFIFLVVLFIFSSLSNGISEELVKLKVAYLPYISYSPVFIALEEGYFREQGLEIELVKFRGSGLSIPALASGSLDVSADSTGANLFAAVARGLKIKIVADKGHLDGRCNYGAIMVRKELYESGEVRKIEQLKGRKVALQPIPVWGYVYEKILNEGNLTLEDIEIVRMPGSSKAEAFQTGAIDAASAGEPLITQLETLGYAVTLAAYRQVVPNYQIGSIVFGVNLIDKDQEIGKKFMIAYLKGIRQFNEGKTERNIEILQKQTGLDPDIIRKICFPAFYPDGHVHTESILAVQDWVSEKGFIDSKVTLDQLVDMSFVEYANRMLEGTEGN